MLVLAATSVVSSSAFAADWVDFDPVEFELDGEEPLNALEMAIEDLPNLTRAYHPEGADISELRVRAQGPDGIPRVVFHASRGIGFMRKTAVVRADIDTRHNARECNEEFGTRGYRIQVDTRDSDHLVAANVSRLNVALCVRQTGSDSALTVVALGRMQKGHDYGLFAGPFVRDLIEAQTEPLLSALMEVVRSYQR